MNSSSKPSKPAPLKHTEPITISRRSRSASFSSGSSSSPSSLDEPKTPLSFGAPRVSPSNSPILSYFLAQSPTNTNGTFPFKRNFGSSPMLEEEEIDKKVPAAAHARRTSTVTSGRFGQGQTMPNLPSAHRERGTGVLRRLSLSSTPPKLNQDNLPNIPSAPPNSAVTPTTAKLPPTPASPAANQKPRRSATLCVDGGRPRRAPSPMGERILKGHFDGFN